MGVCEHSFEEGLWVVEQPGIPELFAPSKFSKVKDRVLRKTLRHRNTRQLAIDAQVEGEVLIVPPVRSRKSQDRIKFPDMVPTQIYSVPKQT